MLYRLSYSPAARWKKTCLNYNRVILGWQPYEIKAYKNQVLLQTSRRRRLPARSGVSFVLLVGPVAVLDADGSLLGLLEALVLAIRPVLVLDHGRCLPVQVLQENKFIKISC